MSHFSIGIITDEPTTEKIEALMLPYCESTDNLPKEYLEFVELNNQDLEDFAGEEDELYDQEEEAYGYWHNPSAKWDWYSLGGRFHGLAPIKADKKEGYLINGDVNIVKISDIDLSLDEETYQKALRFWEVKVEGQEQKEGEEIGFTPFKAEYYTNRFKTKENYAKERATFATYAAILPDGKWLSPGEMGWFGLDDATADSTNVFTDQFYRLLEENKDSYLVIIDAHI